MEGQLGCVYLIGAGCGRMDLVTLRGLQRLRQCDVVVYDDLIDSRLLREAPPQAEQIYMGKRSGRHSASQAEISAVLVEKARAGKRVARLKGGDPFVFGRGGEEIQALQRAGIPYEEVPGISSAIAIPAAAGIPVTHRRLGRSFHVITGHTADTPDGLPEDLEALAGLGGTLVFLMGLSNLRKITAGLIAAGRSAATPAAVVSSRRAGQQVAVRGTLGDLADRAAQSRIAAPAVIVVGDVAALDFSPTLQDPLRDVSVGITGTPAIAEKLTALLEAEGASVELVQESRVEPLPLSVDLTAVCSGAHWLVFTSMNGARIFLRRLREQRLDVRRLHGCRFAVIGAATGEVLERHGIYPDLCAPVSTTEALAGVLAGRVEPGEDVFLLRAENGAAGLPRILRAQGIPVTDVPLYRLCGEPRAEAAAVRQLDYLTFSSASGVEFFFRTDPSVPEGTVCVCIGEITAQALRKHTDRPFLTAPHISAEGMVEAIREHWEKRAGTHRSPEERNI